MMVLITYDVETSSANGARRLRRVAKACEDYGMRVQNSVFECLLDPSQFSTLKHKLSQIIDKESDSIRFYFMGNNWDRHIERMGKAEQLNQDSCLIL